jgi:hypothetical protein
MLLRFYVSIEFNQKSQSTRVNISEVAESLISLLSDHHEVPHLTPIPHAVSASKREVASP